MTLFQLEMYQSPYHNQQQPQQLGTPLVQTNGAVRASQPFVYMLPSAPAVCELYASGQSMVAGIILIIAGVVSLVFHFIGMRFAVGEETTYFSQGIAPGFVVSFLLFVIPNCRPFRRAT